MEENFMIIGMILVFVIIYLICLFILLMAMQFVYKIIQKITSWKNNPENNIMEKLTHEQYDIVSDILKNDHKKVLIIGPCGSGKTYITKYFANVLKIEVIFITSITDMDREGFAKYYLPAFRIF